jgi:type I restriction enzyme S subunit
MVEESATRTGGRDATTRHIAPKLALAVGMPSTPAPKGWRWAALSDIARLESGHTPSRRHPEYWSGDVPWISIRDAKANHGSRIDDTEEKISRSGLENSSARLLPENTVCLSRTASVGYVVVMGRSMATSQDFVNWVCSADLEPDFLKYLLISEGDDLLRFASGAVHQTIYFPEAKAFHICLPTRAVQRRVVEILDEAFAGIVAAKAHAEQNRQNARSLFESHLYSVFVRSNPTWEETTLGEATGGVFTGPFGSVLHKSDYVESGIPLVNPIHITETGIEADYRKSVSQQTATRLAYYRLQAGDIVISRRGEMGRCALVTAVEHGWLCGTGCFFIRPSSKCDMRLLVRYLRSNHCREQLNSLAGGTVMPNLSNTALASLPLQLPPVVAQRRLVATLDALSAETQRLEALYTKKLAALDELKASLLHQAFSGQL